LIPGRASRQRTQRESNEARFRSRNKDRQTYGDLVESRDGAHTRGLRLRSRLEEASRGRAGQGASSGGSRRGGGGDRGRGGGCLTFELGVIGLVLGVNGGGDTGEEKEREGGGGNHDGEQGTGRKGSSEWTFEEKERK
jgi:hypothetical protein